MSVNELGEVRQQIEDLVSEDYERGFYDGLVAADLTNVEVLDRLKVQVAYLKREAGWYTADDFADDEANAAVDRLRGR